MIRDLAPAPLAAALAAHAYDRFPVVEEHKLIGVITRKEAVVALAEGRAPRLESPAICTPEISLREVGKRIVNSPSGLLVVLDRDAGGVIGLVTLHDILRAQISFAQNQQD